MSSLAYAFLGLTAIVAALAACLTFAVLRFATATRRGRRAWSEPGRETAFMAGAFEQVLDTVRTGERALQVRAEASESLSRSIITSLTSGLLIVDDEGIIRVLNPAGAAMLGLGASEGGSFRELLSGLPALAQTLTECLQNGRPVVRRAVAAGAGDTSYLGVSVSPILSPQGTRGAICLFTDLTEVMQLEEQVRLQDSLARLGELTAGIAHEFRNGLATIHGYARLIDLSTLPPEGRRFVQGLRDETQALGEVVARFLTFARPTPLIRAPADLGLLLTRVAEELRAEAEQHGGAVHLHGAFGQVNADEPLLKQAIANICRNALEACLEAGVVPHIEISGSVDERHRLVRAAIDDNGPGIPAGALPRLFQPFFTTRAKGTGLGLALAQKIIVNHDGRIVASNRPERGARFEVTLPLLP